MLKITHSQQNATKLLTLNKITDFSQQCWKHLDTPSAYVHKMYIKVLICRHFNVEMLYL